MDHQKNKVLIAGASGISGSYIAQELVSRSDWQVVGLARTIPREHSDNGILFLAADMLEPSSLEQVSEHFRGLTHLVYAGYSSIGGSDWVAQTSVNSSMFENLVNAVCHASPSLQHILLMQGQKYYGSHLGPYKTPTREDDPRHMSPNFYFSQQDFLIEKAQKANWNYACLRPHIICGLNTRSPMNPLMVIGAYASISRALGLPLRFPGDPNAYRRVYQATDARLLGQAAHWALTDRRAANQAFNITNGDFFRWEQVWQCIAESFDMPLVSPQQISLERFMLDNADLWRQLAKEHNLVSSELCDLANGSFGDYIFNCDWDVMASTIKARKHGFDRCLDSEEMFSRLLSEMADARLIPKL
jgi:nucleoside-diphosphate-sugar epimerase